MAAALRARSSTEDSPIVPQGKVDKGGGSALRHIMATLSNTLSSCIVLLVKGNPGLPLELRCYSTQAKVPYSGRTRTRGAESLAALERRIRYKSLLEPPVPPVLGRLAAFHELGSANRIKLTTPGRSTSWPRHVQVLVDKARAKSKRASPASGHFTKRRLDSMGARVSQPEAGRVEFLLRMGDARLALQWKERQLAPSVARVIVVHGDCPLQRPFSYNWTRR